MFNNPIYQVTLKKYEELRKEYLVAKTMSDIQRMKEVEIEGKKVKSMLVWMEHILEGKIEVPQVDTTIQDAIEIFTT